MAFRSGSRGWPLIVQAAVRVGSSRQAALASRACCDFRSERVSSRDNRANSKRREISLVAGQVCDMWLPLVRCGASNSCTQRGFRAFLCKISEVRNSLAERSGFEPGKPFRADTLTRLAHLFPPVIVIPIISGATAPVEISRGRVCLGHTFTAKFGLEGRSPRAA